MKRQLFAIALLTALSGMVSAQAPAGELQKFPDIVSVKVQASGENRFNFDVTVSSPYDSAKRYADAFRVTSAEGVVYGERKLIHDHADEQPFTRDLYDVRIPAGVRVVVVQARDQKYGYGGKSARVILPGR